MQHREVVGANTDVMYGASALIARRLVIQVNAASANFHEDVADTSEITIKKNLRIQRTHVPVNCRIQVTREKVNVVKMNHLVALVEKLFGFANFPALARYVRSTDILTQLLCRFAPRRYRVYKMLTRIASDSNPAAARPSQAERKAVRDWRMPRAVRFHIFPRNATSRRPRAIFSPVFEVAAMRLQS